MPHKFKFTCTLGATFAFKMLGLDKFCDKMGNNSDITLTKVHLRTLTVTDILENQSGQVEQEVWWRWWRNQSDHHRSQELLSELIKNRQCAINIMYNSEFQTTSI